MDQLTREGALWFARMRGPDAQTYRPEFEHWLSLGASHRDAYDRAGEIFALGRFLATQKQEAEGLANDNEQAGVHWKWGAVAASLILAIGAGVWIANNDLRERATGIAQSDMQEGTITERASYETRPGERRNIRLADGSVIELDQGSKLSIAFSKNRRELRLEHGRARFEVAHDLRPFMVLAGGGTVTAHGTIFDVAIGIDQRVTVRLVQGAVDVERPQIVTGTSTPLAVARLEPGEVLSFTSSIPVPLPPFAGSASMGTSTQGADEPLIREYDRTPLSAVITEANKNSDTTIRIADPSIGALRVSGRFRVDDANEVADRLAILFDLGVERPQPSELVLLKK